MLAENEKHSKKLLKLQNVLKDLDMITIQIQNQTKDLNDRKDHLEQICKESAKNFELIMNTLDKKNAIGDK